MLPHAQGNAARGGVGADEASRNAQKVLWEGLRLVVEPGGCTACAAIRSGA